MDEPDFSGRLVRSRIIGNLAIEQKELDGKVSRNDRIIAVAAAAQTYEDIKCLTDLNHRLLIEVENFFIYYNSLSNREFRVIGRDSADRAIELIQTSQSKVERQPAA